MEFKSGISNRELKVYDLVRLGLYYAVDALRISNRELKDNFIRTSLNVLFVSGISNRELKATTWLPTTSPIGWWSISNRELKEAVGGNAAVEYLVDEGISNRELKEPYTRNDADVVVGASQIENWKNHKAPHKTHPGQPPHLK